MTTRSYLEGAMYDLKQDVSEWLKAVDSGVDNDYADSLLEAVLYSSGKVTEYASKIASEKEAGA